MQGNPHVRFDERDVETEPWSSHKGTARRKGRKQTCPAYRHRATSPLYPQRTLRTLSAGVRLFSEHKDNAPVVTPGGISQPRAARQWPKFADDHVGLHFDLPSNSLNFNPQGML